MKNLIILAVAVCGGWMLGFAQGDAPCHDRFCYCGSDLGCNSSGCTLTPGGCSTSTFTVPCNANFNLVSKVICTSPADPCTNCSACVQVYPTADPTNIVGMCHNTTCDQGSCQYHCNVTLTAGVDYTLKVCLVPCPGNQSTCHDCRASCKAYGCVYLNVIYECVPL